jgi:hypothetical protein
MRSPPSAKIPITLITPPTRGGIIALQEAYEQRRAGKAA